MYIYEFIYLYEFILHLYVYHMYAISPEASRACQIPPELELAIVSSHVGNGN